MDFSVIILLVVIVAIVLFVIGIYNGLIGRRNRLVAPCATLKEQKRDRGNAVPGLGEMARSPSECFA